MNDRNNLVRVARAAVARVALLLVSLIAAIAFAELILRLSLSYLPLPLADALGTGYVDFGNGIYRFDPALNMERMRPHYRREMFFNGYYWHHQGDWMGFRNPEDRHHVDIALIGDSMIYGHGLEEPSTVRSHLEQLLGLPVGNLSIQGGAMDYEYEILRRDAIKLSPRWVFIFFLNNDLIDLDRLSDADLQRFIELPLNDHTTRYFADPYNPPLRPGNFDRRNFYLVRGYLFLIHELDEIRKHGRAPSAKAQRITPVSAPAATGRRGISDLTEKWTAEAPFAGNPRMQLAIRFHLRAIAKADDFARRHDMHFAYVFIATPAPFDSTYESIIADYCQTHGINFFSLRQVYDHALDAGIEIYLPHDDHLTNAGAKITAQALADHFPLRAP